MKKIYIFILVVGIMWQSLAQSMNSFNFKQPINLESTRVLIRNLSFSDAENMFDWCSDERVTKWLTWGAHKSINQTRDLIARILNRHKSNKPELWVFVDKKTKYVFGTGGFHIWMPNHKKAEIVIILSPKYWNKGYATEIIRTLVTFAFTQTDIHRIEAIIACENKASCKVFEKVGFAKEGRLRDYKLLKGQFIDHYIYALTH